MLTTIVSPVQSTGDDLSHVQVLVTEGHDSCHSRRFGELGEPRKRLK